MSNLIKKNRHLPSIFGNFWNGDLIDDFFSDNIPAINLSENKNEFLVELSVPGFSKDQVKVEIDKNVLKVHAEMEEKKETKENKVLRSEFVSSSFYRSFVIPENIDTSKISAKQENGVLTLSLPKTEDSKENKVKKIEVR